MPSATFKEKLAIMYSFRHLIGHPIRHPSPHCHSLREIPYLRHGKGLHALVVHDSRLGSICGPFGHFIGHFIDPYEKPVAYAKIGLL